MSIAGTLQALTGSLQDNGFGPSLEALTGELVGIQGALGGITAELAPLAGELSDLGNFGGQIDAVLEPLSGSFSEPDRLDAPLAALEGSFVGLVGGVGAVDAALASLTAQLDGAGEQPGALGASLQFLEGAFSGYAVADGDVASSLQRLQASFSGVAGTVGGVDARLERLEALVTGAPEATGGLEATMAPVSGYFSGAQEVEEAFRTWVMNTRHNAVTQYTNYPHNSFARYNGTYLAAGPGGLIRLDGDDDVGAPLAWSVATGFMDDDNPGLKRATEVVAGLRASGAVIVTVWKDEGESFEYVLPNYREGVLHQARTKTGKGLRSRYYKVGISGSGPSMELDSLQLTMPETTRRLG